MVEKKYTKDISLTDFCVTETGLANVPDDEQRRRLLFLAYYLIQPVISKFGSCAITSAYRSLIVNKAIGGSTTSQHSEAEACDFIPRKAQLEAVFHWCRQNLQFGQLIFENKGVKKWIHISLPRMEKPNGQVLVFDGTAYRPYMDGMKLSIG